ncbi:MAG: carbohydrate porin [Gammaproteobacteria bacterium]|nr:carbohydrate porin [Gammaproteobacteria bacterium]
MKTRTLAVSMTLALLPAFASAAAKPDELAAIRQQIQSLQADYEQRIQALEARLAHAEAETQAAKQTAAEAQAAATAPVTAPPSASANAFNPAISAILSGTYGDLSNDPDTYAIPGFALGGETGPGERGFSLGESELVISANVDDKFYGNLTAALAPEGGVDVEEAYIQTTALPQGFTLKFGRLFSGIGYLNEQHAHIWDFVDTPLAYRALLGNQYGDDGVQLRWLAPTDLFVEFGAEWMRGDAFPAGGAADDGRGTTNAFVHIGGDVGDSHSWRAGLSQLRAQAEGRETGATPDVFDGDSNVSIADFVWKWAPHGNAKTTNFKFQTEYLQRNEDGRFNGLDYDADQNGWYTQAIYQFMPRWRIGLRYDRLEADDPGAAFAGTVLDTLGHTPHRSSAMLDFSNSEFSRLRVQYNRDDSQPVSDDQFFLQYIMSVGAHGGHQF